MVLGLCIGNIYGIEYGIDSIVQYKRNTYLSLWTSSMWITSPPAVDNFLLQIVHLKCLNLWWSIKTFKSVNSLSPQYQQNGFKSWFLFFFFPILYSSCCIKVYIYRCIDRGISLDKSCKGSPHSLPWKKIFFLKSEVMLFLDDVTTDFSSKVILH